jgi:protein TonB
MKGNLSSRAVICLLATSLPLIVFGQTTNAGKKCGPPQVTYNPAPPPSHYPSKGSALLIVNVLIDEKGRVRDPKITRPSGSDEFDRDALNTVQTWRFKPAKCDGKPIPDHISLEISSRVKQ